MKTNSSVDEHIAKFPESTIKILEQARKTIAGTAPSAPEGISYGIPTFVLNNKNLVHFVAYENHIGFYPGPKAIQEFKE